MDLIVDTHVQLEETRGCREGADARSGQLVNGHLLILGEPRPRPRAPPRPWPRSPARPGASASVGATIAGAPVVATITCAAARPRRVTVVIVLYEGVSSAEALGSLAALRAAGEPAELVARDALVRSHEGARVVPDRLGYDRLEGATAVVLPGGDVARALADAALVRALRGRRGKFVLASGDAARVLAAAGLLAERRVARLPGAPEVAGATSVHARLVADGRVLTCFAGDAMVDLVLHWIGHERGEKVAKDAALALGREYRTFAFGSAQE